MTPGLTTNERALFAARRALCAWGLSDARLALVGQVENIVFRVEDAHGAAWVLRLHRPGYHDDTSLRSELVWHRALRDAGISTPRARPTQSGDLLTEIQLDGVNRKVTLLEWVEGETMTARLERDRDAAAAGRYFVRLGRLTAALHAQATTWRLPPRFRRHALDTDGLTGEAPFWGRFWECPLVGSADRTLLHEVRLRLRRVLADYQNVSRPIGRPSSCDKSNAGSEPGMQRSQGATTDANYSLIHADLHPGNVILDGDRLHVIDFDDAGFGWHAYDLAVALMNYRDHSRFNAVRDALFQGYTDIRPLAGDTQRRLKLFMLVRALAWLGWMAARPGLDFRRHGPALMDYIRRHADSVLGRFE